MLSDTALFNIEAEKAELIIISLLIEKLSYL